MPATSEKSDRFDKAQAYSEIISFIRDFLDGTPSGILDDTAIMATICSFIKTFLPYVFWVGFYRLSGEDRLVVGPYQGTPGTVDICLGNGVCGEAALRGESIIVRDVNEFPGHIACDAQSLSEIVVPVYDANGKLVAVLDIDSAELGAFDEVDEKYLKQVLTTFLRG